MKRPFRSSSGSRKERSFRGKGLRPLLFPPRVGIQWKVTVIFVLLILLAMQLISVSFLRSLEQYYIANFTETVATQGNLLAANLERYMESDGQEDEIGDLVKQFFVMNGVEVQILDPNGVILSATWGSANRVGQKNSQTEVNRALLGLTNEAIRIDAETGQRQLLMAIPIQREGRVLGAVYLEASLEDVYETIGKITNLFASGTAMALGLTAVLGILVTRTITRPVTEITRQARAMARGEFDRQVTVHSNDEIGQLAQAFNHLSRQLQSALAVNAEFVANVSHELRTPLTTLRSYLEALADGSVEDEVTRQRFLHVARQETERMIRLVEDLLTLSRLDSSEAKVAFEPLNLARLIERTVERFQLAASEKGIRLEVVTEKRPLVWGNADQLQQVLDNLLSNALKHTPPEGRIQIRLGQRGEEARVSVRDTGVGIPEEHLPRVFDRFYRVDKARSRQAGGSGLGLSIARKVVEAHGGNIGIKSQVGQGTNVWFTVPLAEKERLE